MRFRDRPAVSASTRPSANSSARRKSAEEGIRSRRRANRGGFGLAFGITAHASTTYTVPQNFGTFNTSQTATLSVSPTSAVAAGDMLVADIATKNVTGLSQQCYVPAKSVADGTSDIWIEASDAQLGGGQVDSSVWYTSPTAGLTSSSSITVTVGWDGVSGCSSYTTAAIAMTVIT